MKIKYLSILLGNEEYLARMTHLSNIVRDRGQADIDEELLGRIVIKIL